MKSKEFKRYKMKREWEWYDENDIYSEDAVDEMLEDDNITPEEAAFMQGYDE